MCSHTTSTITLFNMSPITNVSHYCTSRNNSLVMLLQIDTCDATSLLGFHMAPKLNEIFPESCLLIVVGVVIGFVLVHVTDIPDMSLLTPDTFFLYMLPPIILDAGYFMPNRLFFDHLGTILIFAVVGTIFNTLTIGLYRLK